MRGTRALLALALFVSLITLGAAGPASAAGSLSVVVKPARLVVGSPVTLSAQIRPRVAGRPVVFQRQVGTRWTRIAATATNGRGVAKATTRFTKAGVVRIRAVAKKYRGQPQRTAMISRRIEQAPSTVTASWPSGPWTKGTQVTVPLKVTPKASGRRVWVERKDPTGWVAVSGQVSTSSIGTARVAWRPDGSGTHAYRVAVAGTATHTAAVSGSVSRTVEGQTALEVRSPAWVTTGQVFEMVFAVGSPDTALSGAALTVEVPQAGMQVRPPDDLAVDPDVGRARRDLGTIPAGPAIEMRLRWRAPDQPGTLDVTAVLAAAGVEEAVETTITVHPTPAGGGTFGPGLEMSRESRWAPLTPEMVNGFCWPIEARPVPTYEAAKTAARSYIAEALDPAHAQEWHALPALNHPDLIDEVVFTAFADNRPGAALAASLRGHELAPNDPVHLSNAAAAANRLERPEWAIAFAREAGTLGPGPSVGMQQEAVRLANIGHAWALMRQMDAAEETLRQALLLDPENPHLHQELGVILACQANKRSQALPHVRRGLRGDNAADPMETGTGAHRASWRSASDQFDLSGATRPNQIVLPALPASLHELLGMGATFAGGSGYYDEEAKRLQDRNLALIHREQELRQQLNTAHQGTAPAQAKRTNDILSRIGTIADPRVRDGYEVVDQAWDETIGPMDCRGLFHGHPYCTVDGNEDSCATTKALFDAHAERMTRFQQAVKDYYATAWPFFSGLQANLSDPIAFELAGVKAESHFVTWASSMASNLRTTASLLKTSADDDCATAQPPAQPPPSTDLSSPAPAPCAPGSLETRVAAEIDLTVVKLKANCEKFSFEASVGVYGWLEGFAKVEQPWHGNGATFFVGAKAQVPSAAAFETAYYLEMNAYGQVSDFGLEVGPEAELGGTLKVTVHSDKIRMSAMSAFTSQGP